MSTDIYELNCPFCDKLYKLPRDKVIKHAGKFIHCRRCGKPFSIPTLPPDEPPDEFSEPAHIAPEAEAEPPATEPSEAAAQAAPEEPLSHATDAPAPVVQEESIELPPLSEYTQRIVAEVETMPAETPSETPPQRVEDASSSETIPEAPEASSYFSAGMTAQDASAIAPDTLHHEVEQASAMDDEVSAHSASEETTAAIQWEEETLVHAHADEWATPTSDREEAMPSEDVSHGSPVDEPEAQKNAEEHHTATSPAHELEELAAQPLELASDSANVSPIQSPPPSTPAPQTPLPPPHARPRRGGRAAVAPVFDVEAEEPQPRRRGRFAMTSPPIPSAEIEAPPLAGNAEITVESIGIASTAVEPPQAQQQHLISEPDDEQDVVSDSAPESHPIAKADAGLAASASAEPSLEHSVAAAGTPLPPKVVKAPASPAIQKDLSAIRRFTALLAIMSVVIGLVLIAMLLTMLGIIPKK